MLATDGILDPIELVKHIDKFSTTTDYDKRVILLLTRYENLRRICNDKDTNNWMDESYMNIKEDNRAYMDPYLKDMINKSFVIFERLQEVRRKFTLLATGKKM